MNIRYVYALILSVVLSGHDACAMAPASEPTSTQATPTTGADFSHLTDVTGHQTQLLARSIPQQVRAQAQVLLQNIKPVVLNVQNSYAQSTDKTQWILDVLNTVKTAATGFAKKAAGHIVQDPIKFVKSTPVMIAAALYVLIRCGGIALIMHNLGFVINVIKKVFFDATAILSGFATVVTIVSVLESVLKTYREVRPAGAQPASDPVAQAQ